jgi:hypothetical protein
MDYLLTTSGRGSDSGNDDDDDGAYDDDDSLTVAKKAAYATAKAVCGRRFKSIQAALRDAEFAGADPTLASAYLKTLSSNETLATMALQAEERRKDAEVKAFLLKTENKRESMAWLESQFQKLSAIADSTFLHTSDAVLAEYQWIFALATLPDRRTWAFKLMTSVYSSLLADTPHGKLVMGGAELLEITRRIFGTSYCLRSIRNCVLEGIKEPRQLGREPNFPCELEARLFQFVAKLRSLLYPVYPSTVIDYAKRLLSGTPHCLAYAKKVNGEYVPCEHGGVEWDEVALRNWFYRRFIGDRKGEGARTGNQVILDVARARWQNYAAMRPYYMCHVDALICEGIAKRNPTYIESDLDESGQPREPIAFWIETEMWRAISFDESRLDDATHGEGGRRKARTERIVRCCASDDGEVAGKKGSSYSASLVGGSNAKGEPIPCRLVLACKMPPKQSIFAAGPVALVNGQRFPTTGGHNEKGSVDTDEAIAFLRESVLPMFAAHGGLRADRRGVLVCDGVGTHMTTEFIDFCSMNFITLVLRTPNCSAIQQFEDLVNFWELKNAKGGINWYTLKQQALDIVTAKINRTGGLTHELQIRLLKPCWEVAFSEYNNLKAWRLGGFAREGIRLTPLWTQKHKEGGCVVEGRARSAKERRLEEAHKMGLLKEPDHVRALVAPWQLPKGEDRISKLLGLDDTLDREEGEGEGEDAAETLHSTRLLNAEASRLGVPLTSEPYAKLRRFSDSLSELKHALLPAVKAKMDELLPDVQWKLKDVGKVYLARHLAEEFNKHKMFLKGPDGTLIEKPHRFDAYPKLTPALQKVYIDTFGQLSAAAAADTAQEVTKLPITADMPQEVTKLPVKAFREGRPSKRSRPAETRLDDTWSFGDGADIGSSSTEPAPYPLPLPGLAHTCPFADIVGVSSRPISHERRLMISSDPRSMLTNCARRWPARQPLRPRQKAADSGTGEGGEGTDEASTAACGKHGLGRGAAVDASTRARAARGARSADGSRLRHGRGRREHRRGEHGQHGRGGRRGRRKHGRGHHAVLVGRCKHRRS